MHIHLHIADKVEKNNKEEVAQNNMSSIEFYKHDNDSAQEIKNEYEDQLSLNLNKSYICFVNDSNEEEEEEEEEETKYEPKNLESSSDKSISSINLVEILEKERQENITKLKELHNESKILIIKNKFLQKQYINLIRNSLSFNRAVDKFNEKLIFEDTR
jgi:hypothetical protein